jgi:hypothetical protein
MERATPADPTGNDVSGIAAAAQGAYIMNKPPSLTRRRDLRTATAAASLPLVHIHTAGAAGKLSIGFWDHWVPSGNAILSRQIAAWAEKNKVDVTVDFITSNDFKLTLTAAAEAQAHTGHDALQFGQNQYDLNTYADQLEPIDDAIEEITKA